MQHVKSASFHLFRWAFRCPEAVETVAWFLYGRRLID